MPKETKSKAKVINHQQNGQNKKSNAVNKNEKHCFEIN